MTELADSVALVTGGASGIGAACARLLVARGARVVLADLDKDRAVDVAESLGAAASAVPTDVADPESAAAMVRWTLDTCGRLDIAINCAGVSSGAAHVLADTPLATWRHVLGVNLDGVFHAMRAGGGGSIVNISSMFGVVGNRGSSAYAAAKHGVIGLTRSAALDYADQRIRVNAVGPGFVDTPMLAPSTRSRIPEIAARHPVNRLGQPEEIAQVAVFLASPAASFVTGAFYPVDGGYTSR
jgi:NAD(P)-dependent dehydrogenase (short-subunit alcohol dehydrogenase family)